MTNAPRVGAGWPFQKFVAAAQTAVPPPSAAMRVVQPLLAAVAPASIIETLNGVPLTALDAFDAES
jgi:hypothetical protein